MGIDALDLQLDEVMSEENEVDSIEEVARNEINLEEMVLEDKSIESLSLDDEVDLSELQLEDTEDELLVAEEAYVGFAPKANVNEQQVEKLVLEVQRSLDYYESQLGMGQITQLWLMGGSVNLTHLVDAMQPVLTANVEQPDIADKLQQKGVKIADSVSDINKSVTALGGALAYVAS